MPELPEVELAARRLRRSLAGRRIEAATLLDERLLDARSPEGFAALEGRKVTGIGRRGKYLLLRLGGGALLLVHLRMTGRFLFEEALPARLDRPVRALFQISDGTWALFRDPRRFARFWIGPARQLERLPELAALGPDVLEDPPDSQRLAAVARGRKQPIKALLMDQRRIAGLGNICAIEILHQAKISPARPAGTLSDEEITRVAAILPGYLRWAIRRQARRELLYLGERGAENVFSIYRRAGEPCPDCGQLIQRVEIAGRGTFFCPACQPG